MSVSYFLKTDHGVMSSARTVVMSLNLYFGKKQESIEEIDTG